MLVLLVCALGGALGLYTSLSGPDIVLPQVPSEPPPPSISAPVKKPEHTDVISPPTPEPAPAVLSDVTVATVAPSNELNAVPPPDEPAQTEIAMVLPEEAINPDPPQSPPMDKSAWVAAYDFGPCAHAHIIDDTGPKIRLAAFGQSPEPFLTFLLAYSAEFGTEPDVAVQEVTTPQCDWIEAAADFGAPRIAVIPDDDTPDGLTPIVVRLEPVPADPTQVMAVAPDGSMVDFQSTDEPGRFQLTFEGPEGKELKPGPHLILAVQDVRNTANADENAEAGELDMVFLGLSYIRLR
ncbi:MAG: hypothetical protein AAGF71_15035 [Pseudomonadota bacterium]